VLDSHLSDLTDVVVALFVTKTRETKSGLTSTSVLLGQIHSELMDDIASVSRNGSKQGTVTIHDDEAELGVRFEQLRKGLRVELVIAHVQGGVDGLVRREINIDLLFLTLVSDDSTAVDDKSSRRNYEKLM
jgi:hypothetical protein